MTQYHHCPICGAQSKENGNNKWMYCPVDGWVEGAKVYLDLAEGVNIKQRRVGR